MKKNIKITTTMFFALIIAVLFCACGMTPNNECKTAESIKLETVMLSEVEFKNSDTVLLNQECDNVEISGSIDAMTAAQKSVYGLNDVSHVVALNITFDKERTIDYFKIQGEITKVFSTNNTVENYVGSITDLLDNKQGEDAYANLILSAKTKEYTLTTKYTDGHESEITIKINATLASAESE